MDTDLRVVSPFPDSAVPRIWAWIEQFRSRVSDDYGPQTLGEFVEEWESRRNQMTWGVWRGEELGGVIIVQPMTPCVAHTHALFRKDFWGHKTTVPALQQVYSEVFAQGFHKLASAVYHDNDAMLALAMKLGARKEGVLRQHTRRAGELVDMVAVGLLKEDFERCLSGSQPCSESPAA